MELVEASGYERQKLAESLWHLYHDLSEEARSSNYLAILHQEPFRGFPDETADLAEKLDDPRFHATLVQQYSNLENPCGKSRSASFSLSQAESHSETAV